MASKVIFRAECRTKDGQGFNSHSIVCHYFFSLPPNRLWKILISTIILISEFHNDHILHQIVRMVSACYMWVKVELTEDLFHPKDRKSSTATNLQALPQNLFSTKGARNDPIWTVILQMLFQNFPLEIPTTILRARHIDKITLLQVILRKEEQFLIHWTFLNWTWICTNFHNITSKITPFQQGNLLMLSVCSLILWTHADDAMNPLKFMPRSFQSVWRN